MSYRTTAAPAAETPEMRARTILAERARALARPARVERTADVVSVVLFGIGGVRHAVEAGFVREVLRRPALSVVPSAPAPLLGVANVRGEIVVVADISRLLDVGSPSAPGPVIVLEGSAPPLGILVDEVHDFVDVATDAIMALPGDGATPGGPSESLVKGVIPEAVVLSAAALLNDPRLSTTELRSGR